MSTIFKVKITDIYIPHTDDKKLCSVRDVCYHGNTNITVFNLPKSILFKANFLIKENRHAYKNLYKCRWSTLGLHILKTKSCTMFQVYVTIAIKTSSRLLIYL